MTGFVRSENRTRMTNGHQAHTRCLAGTDFGCKHMGGPLGERLKRAEGYM